MGIVAQRHEIDMTGATARVTKEMVSTPLRRIGEPHEIAGAAVFLAAPASTFMTGQTIIVDGGSTTGAGL